MQRYRLYSANMFSILGAILAIGLLIIVHEAGHYFVARWCKMRVDRFSLGMGPAIYTWRHDGTDFTLAPIPFGGFVLINGMMSADEVDPDDPSQYPNRPVWQRFATIFAGPATNYLTAILFAGILFSVAGLRTGTTWYVISHFDGNVESVGGLQKGDKIIEVNGEPLFVSEKGKPQKPLLDYVIESGAREMTFVVERDGKPLEVTATPTPHEIVYQDWWKELWAHSPGFLPEFQYRLGIDGFVFEDEPRESVGIFRSIKEAFIYPVRQTKVIGKGLYDIITGKQKGELSGPVGIATIAKKSFDAGWIAVFNFMMILNVYLGLFNLLPLPALDGGRLVFLAYEMATRRRANPKVEAMVHMVGIMALMLVMVLVTYKDIAKLF